MGHRNERGNEINWSKERRTRTLGPRHRCLFGRQFSPGFPFWVSCYCLKQLLILKIDDDRARRRIADADDGGRFPGKPNCRDTVPRFASGDLPDHSQALRNIASITCRLEAFPFLAVMCAMLISMANCFLIYFWICKGLASSPSDSIADRTASSMLSATFLCTLDLCFDESARQGRNLIPFDVS